MEATYTKFSSGIIMLIEYIMFAYLKPKQRHMKKVILRLNSNSKIYLLKPSLTVQIVSNCTMIKVKEQEPQI